MPTSLPRRKIQAKIRSCGSEITLFLLAEFSSNQGVQLTASRVRFYVASASDSN